MESKKVLKRYEADTLDFGAESVTCSVGGKVETVVRPQIIIKGEETHYACWTLGHIR